MAAVAKYLVDKSAFTRFRKPAVAAKLGPLADRGVLALCPVIEMEVMVSARSPEDAQKLRRTFSGFEYLEIPADVWTRAIQVQEELVGSSLHRSVKIPDLIVAATAERHRVAVMHYDKDFDRIAEVTGQSTEWVVPPGEAD